MITVLCVCVCVCVCVWGGWAPLFRGRDPKELQGLSSSLNSDEMEKWLLSKMSQRGWVQIINNLAASSLWHQLAVSFFLFFVFFFKPAHPC